jgi:hypothetical protein
MRTTWPKGITNADVDPQGLSVGYWVISASFSYRSSYVLCQSSSRLHTWLPDVSS